MAPLAVKGVVTAAGRMAKTVTVSVERRMMHPIVGKVFATFPMCR